MRYVCPMTLLLVVSLLWAFSFGLIKGNLTGLDSSFVSLARLSVSLVVFLPFLRLRGLSGRAVVELTAIGAVQYGLMYTLYIASYQYLQAHEVALFTVTTPLLVVLTEGALARKVRGLPIAAAALAVIGAAVLALGGEEHRAAWTGFLLLQAANLCFAVGQVAYRRAMRGRATMDQASCFGLLYGGGVLVTAFATALSGGFSSASEVTSAQVWTLIYLGAVPSGLAFFLWNVGATRTSPSVLAVMNNAKIPLGVVVSLLVFGESADPARLLGSLALVGLALWLANRAERS
jgi:drug/metabolite transporter (DMT)-like permease